MSELLNSIIEADKKMVDEKKMIKMAMDKKELKKELEIANIDAEELFKRLDKVKEFEERIVYLERRISGLEIIVMQNNEVLIIHKDNFKEILDSLETNLSIVKDNDERFKRHVNNIDAHKE